ncbi:MAG: hypothetical protein ACFFBP_09315 [Promethearchaeota archaeon]
MTSREDQVEFENETGKVYHDLSIPYLKWRITQSDEEIQRINAKLFSASTILNEIQVNIQKIFRRFSKIDYRLTNLENTEKIKKKKKKDADVSEDQFLRILKVVYSSMEKRFGDFVSVSTITEKIKEYLPLPTKDIHSQLYELFMEYKIDLQTGKNIGGTPLIQDGKEFVWFKFK